MDDPYISVLVFSVLWAAIAYGGARKVVARNVDRYLSAARQSIPFAGPERWAPVESRVARYKHYMNLVQVLAALIGGLLGAGFGVLYHYLDKLMSTHA